MQRKSVGSKMTLDLSDFNCMEEKKTDIFKNIFCPLWAHKNAVWNSYFI